MLCCIISLASFGFAFRNPHRVVSAVCITLFPFGLLLLCVSFNVCFPHGNLLSLRSFDNYCVVLLVDFAKLLLTGASTFSRNSPRASCQYLFMALYSKLRSLQ